MQEVGLVFDRCFLSLDMVQEDLGLFHAMRVRGSSLLGFEEISVQGIFFDAQGVEPTAERGSGRLADLRNFMK